MSVIKKIINLHKNLYFSQIILMDTVSSTQDYLKELATTGQRGVVCLAKHQTNGRGRADRTWFCDAENLKFSMLFDLDIEAKDLPLVSLLAGVALRQTIEKIYNIKVELKWPNDILINEKKICGIISEAGSTGKRVQWVVCGIGANTNMRKENLPEEFADIATSLLIETNQFVKHEDFLDNFINQFTYYLKILETDGSEKIVEIFQFLCNTIGKKVKIILDGEVKFGIAKKIDNLGNIVVETETGEESYCSVDVIHLR